MIALVACAAFLIAAAITRYEHRKQPPGFWGQRIGRSRWRRANLPAGGALMLLLAVAIPSAAAYFLAAAAGMGVAAIGGRVVDPLPRV